MGKMTLSLSSQLIFRDIYFVSRKYTTLEKRRERSERAVRFFINV